MNESSSNQIHNHGESLEIRESDALSALMVLSNVGSSTEDTVEINGGADTEDCDDVVFIEYTRDCEVSEESMAIESNDTNAGGSDNAAFIDYTRDIVVKPTAMEVPALTLPSSSSTEGVLQIASPSGVLGRLNVAGFENIQSYMRSLSPDVRLDNVYLDLAKTRLSLGGNPAFCIDNFPLDGWRKEIYIRMAGHMRGSAEVVYACPDRTTRIRTKVELAKYLSQHRIPLQRMVLFNFNKVYCVCHQPECRRYLECSFGKGGCNGWVHSECVGLGVRSAAELSQMKRVICPLCYHYLLGTGELDSYAADAMYVAIPCSLTGSLFSFNQGNS